MCYIWYSFWNYKHKCKQHNTQSTHVSNPFSSRNVILGNYAECDLLLNYACLITGELHVPLEVCGAVVKRELDYWQISESRIKSCCWRNYRIYIENQQILEAFNHSLLVKHVQHIDTNSLTGWEKYRATVWMILEYPRTSKPAFVRYTLVLYKIAMQSFIYK